MRLQNTPEQQLDIAKPAATDIRAKTASFCTLFCMTVIWYMFLIGIRIRMKAQRQRQLRRILKQMRLQGIKVNINDIKNTTTTPAKIPTKIPTKNNNWYQSIKKATPSHLFVILIILCIKIGYVIASTYEWKISPLRYRLNNGIYFGLGYLPILLILIIFNIFGWCEINEDRLIFDHAGFYDDDGDGSDDDDYYYQLDEYPSSTPSTENGNGKNIKERITQLDQQDSVFDSSSSSSSSRSKSQRYMHSGTDAHTNTNTNGYDLDVEIATGYPIHFTNRPSSPHHVTLSNRSGSRPAITATATAVTDSDITGNTINFNNDSDNNSCDHGQNQNQNQNQTRR